jgi:hypothetical protein
MPSGAVKQHFVQRAVLQVPGKLGGQVAVM